VHHKIMVARLPVVYINSNTSAGLGHHNFMVTAPQPPHHKYKCGECTTGTP